MGTNIEIKVRVRDLPRLKKLVEGLSDTPGETIPQEDVFFAVPRGRLKLRILAPGRGELIYYERHGPDGPKQSDYVITPTADPAMLRTTLASALGVRGVVRKERLLYRVGNTRIHLDNVEGLGSFLELEVVLGPGDTAPQGTALATQLMKKIGINETELIDRAYIDLQEARRKGTGTKHAGLAQSSDRT